MIRAFVGRNGGGKSAAMTATMAIPSWQRGRVVVANYALKPEALGYPRSLFRPLRSYADVSRLGRHVNNDGAPRRTSEGELWSLTNNKGCTLLLDEITSVMPSRDAVNVPPELQRMINQLRKPDIWLGWTAPAWERADLILREVTMDVCYCRAFMPRLTAKRVKGTAWPQNRVFRWSVFDAFDYEEASKASDLNALKPIEARLVWRRKMVRAMFAAYDTLQGVELLDHIQCEECGGKFSRKVCKDPEGHSRASAERRAQGDHDAEVECHAEGQQLVAEIADALGGPGLVYRESEPVR